MFCVLNIIICLTIINLKFGNINMTKVNPENVQVDNKAAEEESIKRDGKCRCNIVNYNKLNLQKDVTTHTHYSLYNKKHKLFFVPEIHI